MSDLVDCFVPLIAPNSARFYHQRYIFPIQFTAGIFGNILNLLVLNGRAMRSKTNTLLSCLAGSDVCCLIANLPLCLAAFDLFAYSNSFRKFFYFTRMPCVAGANWFSAASIWFTLAVTIERALAIRWPLFTQTRWRKVHISAIISSILILSFVMTFYYNLWYIRIPAPDACAYVNSSTLDLDANATFIAYKFIPATSQSNFTRSDSLVASYIKFSLVFGSVCIVGGPLILLTVLNFGLVHYIRKSNKFLANSGQRHNEETMQSYEHKVTIMVCVLVAAFIVFNCPSAVLHLWHLVVSSSDRLPDWHPVAVEVSNALITTGKVLNFVLYCMTSKRFRIHAKNLLMCREWKKRGRNGRGYQGCSTGIVICTTAQTSDNPPGKEPKKEAFEMNNLKQKEERVPFV